ncbi:DUF4974 domain-containing protein [Odoribacter sp. AF15-53]|nr:DUF4974 domain-containing protein [Odoribacter sp. AF15-53]
MNIEMKRDFNKIVTLMRKAYSETLQDGEQEEFEEVLENKALRDVYSEIGDDDYLEKHFARYEKFSPEKAYETFRLNQRKSRFRLILRRVSVAACFILPLLGAGMWMLLQKEQVESPVVLAKKENVQLKLSDGRIVNVSTGNENEIQEQGGLKVRLENGQLSYKQDSVGKSELVYNELIVPQGGECYVVLDDGTRVWVNAGSRIKYPVRFSGKERVVTVKGEAYFDVTKDGRPFVVETNLGKVNVLGTSFGVMAYENEAVLTTLVSGKVMFTGKEGKSVVLAPGEQAVVSLAGTLTKREVNVEEYVGWKDGWYIFKEKRLEDVMHTLSRWYDVSVFYQNPKVKDIRFSGNLKRYDSIRIFLEVLAGSEEVKYKIDGNVVILYE